jgi:hypothetical protein
MEPIALEEYQLKCAEKGENVLLIKSGLVIDKNNQELGVSPDGIVYNQETKQYGIVEIKNLLKNKAYTLAEATKKCSNFCLELTETGCLHLKRNHSFFYQVQGLANILEKDWVDFVVRVERPYQLHIERIMRDKQLWEQVMLPKLKCFFKLCMLPELAAPRNGLCPGIREPKQPWVSDIIQLALNNTPYYLQQHTITWW